MIQVALYSILLIFASIVVQLVSQKVQDPFIDEFFHLRQCLVYCDYKFDVWDNKITTPPGLYYLGFAYTKLIAYFGVPLDTINAKYDVLRSLNLVGGLIFLPLFVHIYNKKIWWVNIISLPLLTPYYFLFYTDIWSLVFVIGSLAFTRHSVVVSGILGFVSLWFRQTNIIWIAFIASVYIDQFVNETDILPYVHQYVKQAFNHIIQLAPYVINFVLFGLFLKINGGITLGDKENHQVQIHLVQIFYAVLFINFFTFPTFFSFGKLKSYVKSFKGPYFIYLPLNIFGVFIIHYIIENFTIIHPFLLADNRHYTFYLWKRVLSHKYSSIAMVPIYHFGTWNIIHSLIESKVKIVVIFSFVMANLLTIVPSPLFEPRYYITPLVVYRMLTNKTDKYRNLAEFMWSSIINVIIMYIFFTYEFTWDSEEGLQRIIW